MTGYDDTYDHMTVKAARRALEQRLRSGAVCPCCRQYAKVYKRKLNADMARWLIAFYKADAVDEFKHVSAASDYLGNAQRTGDYGKLRFWGLIEPYATNTGPDKRGGGHWRVTDAGVAFVLCRASVPSYALIYNNELLDLEGEPVMIDQALGKRFRYQELMSA